jgi:4-amino-4-deoxy-L-arabinose transferase-like glycosyltransferase
MLKNSAFLNLNKTNISIQVGQFLNRNWVLALLLFLLTFALRIPFPSSILYHWDSVNFAYAIHEFNIAKEQPQPPGYILYVWLSGLVDAVVHNAQITLVAISMVASALAVVALFYLGRAMFNRSVGLIAASFLATSPLFWFYGEIALPHTLDTLLIIVSVWWLYQTMRGDDRYLYPAIVVLAITGGGRQQSLVFLAPLLLFALRRAGRLRFLKAAALGLVICLGWFIPLITLNNGFFNYMWVMGEFSRRFDDTTSVLAGAGWWGLKRNLIKLTLYTLYGWSVAITPVIIYAAASRWWQIAWRRHREKAIFLCLWLTPPLIFYIFIHMGQQGLVFIFLPALLLLSALSLTQWLKFHRQWLITITTVIVIFNIGIFCFAPEYPLGPDTQRLLTHATLVNSDHYYRDRFEAIEKNFPSETTAILAANWHHVEYYLPNYTKVPFGLGSKWEQNAGIPLNESKEPQSLTLTELGLQFNDNGQAIVVIFDPNLANFNRTPEQVKKLPLPGGDHLDYMTLGLNDHLDVGPTSFGLTSQ